MSKLLKEEFVVPTTVQAPVVNTTAGIFRFDRKGNPAGTHCCFITNGDPAVALYVLINGGDAGAASATNWDVELPVVTGAQIPFWFDATLGGRILVRHISLWLPVSFAGTTMGTHFNIRGTFE